MSDFNHRELLHSRGLRATPQRVIILGTLESVDGHRHLTARDIFEAAKDQLPGLNVTTVYRTLEGLNEVGLVDLLVCGNDQVRFSFRHPSHRHGHLVCHKCGAVFTVEIELVARMAALIAQECDFKVDEDHLTLGGLCRACREGAAHGEAHSHDHGHSHHHHHD